MKYYNVKELIAPLIPALPYTIQPHVQDILNIVCTEAELREIDPGELPEWNYGGRIISMSRFYHMGYGYKESAFITAFADLIGTMDVHIRSYYNNDISYDNWFRVLTILMAQKNLDFMISAIKWLGMANFKFELLTEHELMHDLDYYKTWETELYALETPVTLERYGVRDLQERIIIRIVIDKINPSELPPLLIKQIRDHVYLVWTK